MGMSKKENLRTRKNKSKVSHKSVKDTHSQENVDAYDIDVSDEELNEVPAKWYDEVTYEKLPKTDYNEALVEAVKQEAEAVLNDETNNFRSFLQESKKSETKWMMTMAKSGTSTDKVAALALMIQESPIHNLSALSSLVNMAKPSKKHQFMAVLDTLTELFITDLLHPAKKLKNFQKQPVAHLSELCGDDNAVRRKRLCHWLFEERLKTLFATFVNLLNTAAHDSVQSNREKAIGAMLKLLLANREQEDVLMCNLINKFGDPVHKVSSRVVYGLEKVAHKHPNMKEKILDEVEKMLFRVNISKRAQYYGICFLSQYKFGATDKELCRRLITLYFSFFKACVKTGDIDSKLMGALLVGVNRAYPYASRGIKPEMVIPVEHINTMYKVVHFAPFKISLQALSLLLQVTNTDRYYNTLYRKLLEKELLTTSHQAIWLNLVVKSIRKDKNENRKKSFIKRILQICLYFPVPLLCGTLIMISQILKHIEDIRDNFEFIDHEVNQKEPALSNIVSNLKRFDDDEEDEKVFDAKTDGDETEATEMQNSDERKPSVRSSWFHRDLVASNPDLTTEKKFRAPTVYDPSHRNPAFAGGEKATFVELIPLAKHYHPTVSLFARKIISGEKIHYTGDPLKDFTMLHFLERFSFRNPKKNRHDKGEDRQEMFRAVGSERKHYNPTGMRALPVQSDLYLKQSESTVPVDELFLYKYLKEKKSKLGTETENSGRSRKAVDSDDDSDISDTESVGSVEFNDYLDTIMVGKKSAENLDFAGVIDNTRNIKKPKKIETEAKDEEFSDDTEDDEQFEDKTDEEVDEMSVEDFSGGSDGENELDVSEFEEDQEDPELPFQHALRKRINRDFGNIAVPVEQFSEMLEEAGKSKSGGSHDILNKDKSSEKQLKWEASKVKQRWRNMNTQNSKSKWNSKPSLHSYKRKGMNSSKWNSSKNKRRKS